MPPGMNLEQMLKVMATANAAVEAVEELVEAVEDKPEPKRPSKGKAES